MDNGDNRDFSVWGSAGLDGLYLAAVTIAVTLCMSFLPGSGVASFLLSTLGWTVKTVGSVWLLLRFMRRFAAMETGGSVFAYGLRVCLCSSLVIAAFMFAYYKYLFPDVLDAAIETYRQTMTSQPGMPAEYKQALDMLEDNAASMMCSASLIKDVVLGLICSAILQGPASRVSDNPFDNVKDDDELR